MTLVRLATSVAVRNERHAREIGITTMSLFKANIGVRIVIADCPRSGIEALDWRREHGFSDRLDNYCDVEIRGNITESQFRKLIKSGYGCHSYEDGSQTVAMNSLRREYDPLFSSTHGHRAVLHIDSPYDFDIDYACEALIACTREQLAHDIGEDKLRAEKKELLERLAVIDSKLAVLG